jgi:hypothetical protein
MRKERQADEWNNEKRERGVHESNDSKLKGGKEIGIELERAKKNREKGR